MFFPAFISLFKELNHLIKLAELSDPPFGSCLPADSSHLIHVFHSVAVFCLVESEPLEGGVENFFFKSIPSSSFPNSIILFKKSTSSCLPVSYTHLTLPTSDLV